MNRFLVLICLLISTICWANPIKVHIDITDDPTGSDFQSNLPSSASYIGMDLFMAIDESLHRLNVTRPNHFQIDMDLDVTGISLSSSILSPSQAANLTQAVTSKLTREKFDGFVE